MKLLFNALFGILLIQNSIAQQDIQLSNFDYASSYYNPASITNTRHICGNVIIRNQWSGFTGSPKTGFMNVGYNYSNILWANLSLTKDILGLQNNDHLKLSLAKSFQLSKKVSLAIGLSLNYLSTSWKANFITPDTPVPNDLSIPNSNTSTGNFDMDFGFFLRSKNISIGLSTTHVTEPKLSQNSFVFQQKRHYYVLCGYTIQKRIGDFENFLLAKSDVSSTQIDLKTNFWHNQGWMIGLSYRLSDAIIPMIGYQDKIGRIRLRGIYSYDITTSKLNTYSSGSHELSLNICIAPMIYPERYTHPRHLGAWK